jgi:chromosome segregation ATPase
MTRRKKLCSNCGLIPAEKHMRKLADQNFYCNDCRGALVNCNAKELKSLGHPYYLNFQKLKNEQGQLRNQQRNQSQELTALQQEKNCLTSQLTNLQIALDKTNQEIQNEREIHQDSLKIQDNWYRRLPPESNNLKNILTDLKANLEAIVKEKKEIQEDTQKVIQNHQQEILQLHQQVQQSELPKSTSRLVFWKRS